MILIASVLPRFFADQLLQQRQVSPHTIAAYRDTFRLFLEFARHRLKKEPTALPLEDVDAALILEFLQHIEKKRSNCARTRNARLAAIRSFFRFVAVEEPALLDQAQRILAVPQKRYDRTPVSFLSQNEIGAFLAGPDKKTWLGLRDFAMLLLMIQTGLRVSEITGLRVRDVVMTSSAYVQCRGKGRKQRSTPLTRQTVTALRAWIDSHALQADNFLFPSRRGTALTRDAVERRVAAYAKKAETACPSLKQKHITPHSLRHTTAMQLLEAKVDTAVIALWLGHESIETTAVYLQADLSIKEQALAQTAPVGVRPGRYRPPDPLLRFLESL